MFVLIQLQNSICINMYLYKMSLCIPCIVRPDFVNFAARQLYIKKNKALSMLFLMKLKNIEICRSNAGPYMY